MFCGISESKMVSFHTERDLVIDRWAQRRKCVNIVRLGNLSVMVLTAQSDAVIKSIFSLSDLTFIWFHHFILIWHVMFWDTLHMHSCCWNFNNRRHGFECRLLKCSIALWNFGSATPVTYVCDSNNLIDSFEMWKKSSAALRNDASINVHRSFFHRSVSPPETVISWDLNYLRLASNRVMHL